MLLESGTEVVLSQHINDGMRISELRNTRCGTIVRHLKIELLVQHYGDLRTSFCSTTEHVDKMILTIIW